MPAIIGITTYNGMNLFGNPIIAVQTYYVRAVLQAGGVPVLLPCQLGEEDWKTLYPRLDGILFTGGGDIRTDLFNGVDHPSVDGVDDERDALELPLLRAAAADGKPFLGICCGFQVVNVALGGRLYTHIPDQHPNALRHDWYPDVPRDYLAHPVRVEEGSAIAKIFGATELQVNSLHHQGVKELAPSLRPAGYAPDGLLEALELPGHPFGFAVQWHPEWLTNQEPMRRLFGALVKAARKEQ
jgi:putative glutamine amidotransferase